MIVGYLIDRTEEDQMGLTLLVADLKRMLTLLYTEAKS